MAESRLFEGPDRAAAVREMFDRIAPRYRLMNRILTFGQDGHWRRRAVARLGLPTGSLVVDVGCGSGELCLALASAGYRAVGVDVSAGMLREARATTLVQGDGLRLPLADALVDGLTSGFALRNVVDQEALFVEMARVLRPGGRLALLEVAEPTWQPAHAVHRLYFHRLVPLVGGLLSDRAAYRYLPASSALLPDGRDLRRLVERAGFLDVRRRLLGLGAVQVLTATRACTDREVAGS